MLKRMFKGQGIEEKSRLQYGAGMAACFLLSIIISNSTIANFQSPLNVAAAGALSPPFASAMLAGSLITYLATGKLYASLIHIMSLILVTISRWIFIGKINSRQSALLTSVCMIFSTMISAAAIKFDAAITAVYICMGILCGLGTFFISEAINSYKSQKIFQLNGTAGCALAVCYVLMISALASIPIPLINIARITGTFVILCAAKRYRYAGGAICGILTSCGVMIYSKDIGMTSFFLGITGLVSGFFSEFRRIVLAFFFIAVNAIGLMLIGVDDAAFFAELDIIIGALIFVFTPSSSLNNIFIRSNEFEENITKLILSRFDFLGNSLMAVRRNAQSISKMLSAKYPSSDISTEVCDKICSKCKNKLSCWTDNFEYTNAGFNALSRKRSVALSSVANALRDCTRREEIAQEFTVSINKSYRKKFADAKLKEIQGLLFEQMEITEQIIESACKSITENIDCDTDLTKQITNLLRTNDVPFISASACFNASEKLIIEIYFSSQNFDCDIHEISDIISVEFNKNMRAAEPVFAGNAVKVVISQEYNYSITCAYEKTSGVAEPNPSGDSCDCFEDGYGNMFLILSDGMGTGRLAAIESRMVISHFKKLAKSGISHDAAIRLVNSIMRNKSDEENFATLDIAKINLDTGKLNLIKLGASATLIKHQDNIIKITSSTFPVGIMHDASPSFHEPDFIENDLIIMLSDGVDESEYSFIKDFLLNEKRSNLKNIAEKICSHASVNSKDDVTVMVARLCKLS